MAKQRYNHEEYVSSVTTKNTQQANTAFGYLPRDRLQYNCVNLPISVGIEPDSSLLAIKRNNPYRRQVEVCHQQNKTRARRHRMTHTNTVVLNTSSSLLPSGWVRSTDWQLQIERIHMQKVVEMASAPNNIAHHETEIRW